MTDYEWLTKMNLCHKCRKQKPAPERKFCFDCLEVIKVENAKRYNSEKAKKYNQRRRELYEEHKSKGICVRCNKKATNGLYCLEHNIKAKKRSRERAQQNKIIRHERGLIPKYRIENGLCLVCGEKIEESNLKRECKVCKKHSDFFSECGKKGKNNSAWKEDNKIVFAGKTQSTNREL